MADEKYTFEQARIRLEEIAVEVRKKDTSLEKSLDLLEEGVRLANICTDLVDHPDVSASVPAPAAASDGHEAVEAPGEAPVEADIPEAPSQVDGAPSAHDELDVDGFDDVDEPTGAPDEEDSVD